MCLIAKLTSRFLCFSHTEQISRLFGSQISSSFFFLDGPLARPTTGIPSSSSRITCVAAFAYGQPPSIRMRSGCRQFLPLTKGELEVCLRKRLVSVSRMLATSFEPYDGFYAKLAIFRLCRAPFSKTTIEATDGCRRYLRYHILRRDQKS